MKTTDSLAPYILMSMHPLLHVSMFASGMIMLQRNKEEFYKIEGTCEQEGEAKAFIDGKKYTFMNYAMTAHAVCIFCHYFYQLLNY